LKYPETGEEPNVYLASEVYSANRRISEFIFDLIADMPNYGRWLPGSEAFSGTTKVSRYPIRLGTTYLDAGPAGERPGSRHGV
jgi:hypothetical protein